MLKDIYLQRSAFFAWFITLTSSHANETTTSILANVSQTGDLVDPVERMWNGDLSCWKRYPFFVFIQVGDPKVRVGWCSGGLITKEIVITAAHCLDPWNNDVGRVVVWSRINSSLRRGSIALSVKRVLIHPLWQRSVEVFPDFALIILRRSSFGNAVPKEFLLLPEPYEDNKFVDKEKKVIVLAMGASIPIERILRLKEARVTLQTHNTHLEKVPHIASIVEDVKLCPGQYCHMKDIQSINLQEN